MLFLPAAALCCLCSALVAMAAELIQDDLTLTREADETVSFSCQGTDQCGSYIFWYQKKDTDTFTRILYIQRSDGYVYSGYDHPQKDDFSAVNKQNGCELKIQKVKLSHSATYYCACWKGTYLFGSGTKLYVTDDPVVKPVVSVYPAASRENQEEKKFLLCVAADMFPPLVRFSWKRRKENGPLEELPPTKEEQQELKDSECIAAIRVTDQNALYTYEHICYVQHETGREEAQLQQEVPAKTSPPPSFPPSRPPSCPPSRPPSCPPSLPPSVSFQSQCRVKLLWLLYTVLIVKSLVYCCGLSLLRILGYKGPSTCCTHAD
ncbi:uncharacterized protein LOC119902652 [Micropterus salmoides]|uniref:uncharacterized protein LOC119902652 n=1 Tax=Micropterus salmoides TaxID=27706 RepID=UPI0018EAF566|nr:uncharacterized protein LOC119902652 [Micropterus salmoides]